MNLNTIIFGLFLSFGMALNAQVDPVAHFDFNNCSVIDVSGTFNPGEASSNIDCDCGVGENSNAFYFDGSPDSLVLDSGLKSIFEGDFSIGFYLWTESASSFYPILSIQGDCATARDSAFFVRYDSDNDDVVFEFTKNFGELVQLRANLDTGFCWNHVLFTKEGTTYSLYLNGEFIESVILTSIVNLGVNYPFLVGTSPCVGITDQYFDGRIDELKLFNYAVKEDDELQSILVNEDHIITSDTTIFEGSSFMIDVGHSCVSQPLWSPGSGLSSPNIFEPIASPLVTTEYTVLFDHGTCESRDNITISVLSQDQIDCANILLPNAFTPNNDALNDTYGISNNFIVESISRFEIFNRWGQKLWQGINKNDRWDGMYKGERVPSGTYVYKIEYTCLGDSFRKSGSFNILK